MNGRRMRRAALGAMMTLGAFGCSADPGPVGPDGAVDGGGFIPFDAGPGPTCRGNRDGVISRDELVFVVGAEGRYRVNPAGTLARLDTRGTMRPDGSRAWDLRDAAGDLVSLRLEPASTQWFAARFPEAQYAARLDPRAPLLGVYRATDTAVQLLGAAGPAASSETVIPYATPLDVLRFPLRLGDTWTATSQTQDATVEGVPAVSRDRYEITVDARGEVRTEAITFSDALRVRVELTQTFPAGPGTRRIQYLWMAECYGEVARAVAREGEVNPEFSEATEFRRIGL